MEQRPLRLGDIVDDYCPRERRITNHAIVALVGETIRQTRCTTCDSDHVYKEGRVPRRRKKDDTAALYDQVLADASGQLVHPRAESDPAPPGEASAIAAPDHEADAPAPALSARAEATDDSSSDSESEPGGEEQEPAAQGEAVSAGPNDGWLAHRRLIRATLPRTENDPPTPRPIPEFTMHQRQPPHRGGHGFRYGQSWQNGNGNGSGGGHRHGTRQGRPGGDGNGNEPNGNRAPQPGGGQGQRRSRHRGGRHRRAR